jgi:hypothetical protein
MLRLVRNTWITLECHPKDCWVGTYWERKQARYRTGKGMVTAELHVWICLVPCFPLHVIHTTGLRRVPAGDERRRSWGVVPHLPLEEIPGMTWSWLTRKSR